MTIYFSFGLEGFSIKAFLSFPPDAMYEIMLIVINCSDETIYWDWRDVSIRLDGETKNGNFRNDEP